MEEVVGHVQPEAVHAPVQPEPRDVSPKQAATYGKISTFVLMVVAAVWAPNIANFGGLWSYLQQMFGIFVPPVVILFILGVFDKRGNGDGAFWTLVLGIAGGIALFALSNFTDAVNLQFTYRIGIMLVVSAALFMAISRMTPAPRPEVIAPYTYSPDLVTADTQGLPWYKDYRTHCVGLAGLLVWSYIALW